jgi:hypothetical protein
MTHHILQTEADNIVRARISGLMTLDDQRALEAVAKTVIEAGHDVRVVVSLEAFEGWEKSEAWGDNLQFQFEYGGKLARIAVVGDERWKEQAFLFLGKGFRDTEVEFFPAGASQAAESWLRR